MEKKVTFQASTIKLDAPYRFWLFMYRAHEENGAFKDFRKSFGSVDEAKEFAAQEILNDPLNEDIQGQIFDTKYLEVVCEIDWEYVTSTQQEKP